MSMIFMPDDGDFWLLPYSGNVVTRWDPETEEVREYPVSPEGFQCRHTTFGFECTERPFGSAVCHKDYVYLSPCWGNQYVRLNKSSGEAVQWKPPAELAEKEKNGYFTFSGMASFVTPAKNVSGREHLVFSGYDRKLYKIDLKTNEWQEIDIGFDRTDLEKGEAGFQKESQWLQ